MSDTKITRKEALDYHNQEEPGKIEVMPSKRLENEGDLSLAYTPGVAYASEAIDDDPSTAWDYTFKGNTIAILTDGSRVLGLGDIGPLAGMPVMEGKALLFKVLGDVNAVPLCLDCDSAAEITETMERLEPVFGGVNVEDIRPPRCFEVEESLSDSLSIPTFHDDQHGTAVVTLAALYNALDIVGKKLEDVRVVVNGAGSAGTGITNLLVAAGAEDIIVLDTRGALYREREGLTHYKWEIAHKTNEKQEEGNLTEVIKGADVFIGVSAPNVLNKAHVESMNADPIIFALANPVPEISPADALDAGAAVVGTGSSEHPNQVNNVLAFPGIFRGVLDCRADEINEEMLLAAAHAIANLVEAPSGDEIIPHPLDRDVVPEVAAAVIDAATETGVSRRDVPHGDKYKESVRERVQKHKVVR